MNKYEQQRKRKQARHSDMEERVSPEALEEFHREAYPDTGQSVRDMLTIKRDLTFLQNRIGMLDLWERETIKRIVERIRKGDD